MKKPRLVKCIIAVALIVLFSRPVFGQWRTQTIALRPGWNAIFLEVQPEPDECQAVFQGLPVESVWMWNKRFSSVQFIHDPSLLLPAQPGWLAYFPPENPNAFLSNLFIIQGGRPYLIKVGGNEPVVWEVTGKPIIRPIEWISNSFNLVGFSVDPAAPPTFASFFGSASAHADKEVYRLNPYDHWELIPATEFIRPGEAYWVFCDGHSKFSGPVRISFEFGSGLDFGRILTEQVLHLKNETSSVKQVTFGLRTSLAPPEGAFPLLAGEVLLSYWNTDILNWIDFPDQLQFAIQPGKELALRMAVRRKDMPGGIDKTYQSLIEVADGQGSLSFVPVTADGMIACEPESTVKAKKRFKGELTTPYMRAGLWVGTATLNKVSYVAAVDPDKISSNTDDTLLPLPLQPTGSEFQFRLIIHVDGHRNVRLLQQATLMWQNGTLKDDPADPGKKIVDEPGRYVIVTNDTLLPRFSGVKLLDGSLAGRRISTAAFTFSDPVLMAGNFDESLTCNGLTTGYNDPLNPFKHKYHPDHDNLDYDFKTMKKEGKESYDIVRDITLTFTSEDPENLKLAGWGDNQVGGIYREKIRGVHKRKLEVQGHFRLRQVSPVAVLNDGLQP